MILSLLLSLFLQSPSPVEQQPLPNIVVIVLDDVGFTDINNIPDLPNLQKLASLGVVFNRFYGSPTCSPARECLMFGKYGVAAGNMCNGPLPETPDVNQFSLFKAVKERGYTTFFGGKWHLGTNNLGAPWEQTTNFYGIDRTIGLPQNISDACDVVPVGDYDHWVRFDGSTHFLETRYNTKLIRNQFMIWWNQTTGPKFAYVAFTAPHAPFHIPPSELVPNPPDPAGLSTNRWMYEQMTQSVDTVIGQLLQVLDASNTYVIIVGDNGTPPNAVAPGQPGNKVKTTTFEGGIRIPCIIVGPNIMPGVSESLTGLVDILPTIADMVGNTVPPDLDGMSLLPVLNDPAFVIHDHIFASDKEMNGILLLRDRAVVQERYKLRLSSRNGEQFFDLLSDPMENTPLSPSLIDPMIVQSLRDEMIIYTSRGL